MTTGAGLPLLILLLAASLQMGPARAAPLLDMAAPATQIGGWAESPSTLRLPIGPFAAGQMPLREVAGQIDQRAYRMEGQRLTTLQLITPLLAQLAEAGYQTLYQCDTSACGGFDFRYGMDVLPEPQMHVDLGDFRYVAAERASTSGPDLIALLVSRSADTGFVQVTTISAPNSKTTGADPKPAVAAASPTPAPDPTLNPGPAPAPDLAPAPATDPASPAPTADKFGQTLLDHGALALDDLIFASGSAVLEAKAYASLSALSAWLKANPTRHVTLVGHTDASGALPANITLSRQRAQSVRAALIASYAADPSLIDAQGAGYLAPRASNETTEGRTQNRRVEVMLTPTP